MKNGQKHPSVHLIFEHLFDERYEKTLKAFSGIDASATGLTKRYRHVPCAITAKCGRLQVFFD